MDLILLRLRLIDEVATREHGYKRAQRCGVLVVDVTQTCIAQVIAG